MHSGRGQWRSLARCLGAGVQNSRRLLVRHHHRNAWCHYGRSCHRQNLDKKKRNVPRSPFLKITGFLFNLESTNTGAYLISWTLFEFQSTKITTNTTNLERNCCFLTKQPLELRGFKHLVLFLHLPPLGTLPLQFFDESDKVEDDSLAFRGDDAFRVELDTLKTVTVSSHYNTSPEFQGEHPRQEVGVPGCVCTSCGEQPW